MYYPDMRESGRTADPMYASELNTNSAHKVKKGGDMAT